jgi:hypothetical protein
LLISAVILLTPYVVLLLNIIFFPRHR